MRGDVIHIDGSFGEGGGQILRTSLALSCITSRPFAITHIRANRTQPGLRPQHLQCVRAAARIADADVAGAEVGSSQISFEPGAIRAGGYRFDIGTAGSTSLVLHTVVFPLAFAGGPSSVTITGGTHAPFAPCFHYLEKQWLPAPAQSGFQLSLQVKCAEKVADEACKQLLDFLETDGAIDRYLADQLLIPLALASGESHFTTERVTQHLPTNAEVIRRFLPSEVHIEGDPDEPCTVTVHGVGWEKVSI